MTEAQITLFGLTMNPPAKVELFGISFFWSGLFVAVGFLAAVIYCLWRCKKFGLKDDNVTDALILAVPAAIIGARLFYVIGNLSYFMLTPAAIIQIWDGGFSLLGGLIFAVGVVWLFCRKKQISMYAMLDAAGPALLLGNAVSVWGDFFGRTGYGNLTGLFWKMGLTANGETMYVHPLFLYTFICMAVGFVLMHRASEKREREYDGQLFAASLALFCFVKVIFMQIEAGMIVTFSFARFLAAVAMCVAIILLVHNKLHVKHDPAELFVNGGPAFPNRKQTKKGRYGTYYDDEINDETDELSIGASYDLPDAPVEDKAEDEEETAEEEDEDDGFEPFGDAAEEDK